MNASFSTLPLAIIFMIFAWACRYSRLSSTQLILEVSYVLGVATFSLIMLLTNYLCAQSVPEADALFSRAVLPFLVAGLSLLLVTGR